MIKNNKLKIVISSVIILLPIFAGLILWNKLPDTMAVHWGADNTANGFASKAFAVFFMPAFLVIIHLLCIFLTSFDKKQQNQNKKALNMVFWIIPVISLFTNGIMYSVALGRDVSIASLTPALIGTMLIFVGNYLPKVKQNSTIGIKIYWTLRNEENWNKTHRLAGRLWVICGLVIILSVFLPNQFMLMAPVLVLILAVLIPFLYSYSIYKKHKGKGIEYKK